MAFWGGFMAQDSGAMGDHMRAMGWLPTMQPIQVVWPIYIYVDSGQSFDVDSLHHLESPT